MSKIFRIFLLIFLQNVLGNITVLKVQHEIDPAKKENRPVRETLTEADPPSD